jgi:hypothetical protein
VSRALIPNTVRAYKGLGDVISNARLAGLIDWDLIEDRTRNLQSRAHFADPKEVVEAAYQSHHLDRWKGQEHRVECWVEKDALAGVFSRVCRKWDVPLFPCRGYVSQSEMWSAAMRLQHYEHNGQTAVIIHFGDHDPSGIDMTRDIQDRMATFGCNVSVSRLALNMDQVEQYKPPPNPAKATDARFQAYLETYGEKSWELDALDPATLSALVEAAVQRYRDPSAWQKVVKQEIEERAVLRASSDHWEDVASFLHDTVPEDIADHKRTLRNDPRYQDDLAAKKK